MFKYVWETSAVDLCKSQRPYQLLDGIASKTASNIQRRNAATIYIKIKTC